MLSAAEEDDDDWSELKGLSLLLEPEPELELEPLSSELEFDPKWEEPCPGTA